MNCLEFLNTFKLIMRANMAADQGRILHTCVTEYLCRRCLVFYSNYFLFLLFAKILNMGDFKLVPVICFFIAILILHQMSINLIEARYEYNTNLLHTFCRQL